MDSNNRLPPVRTLNSDEQISPKEQNLIQEPEIAESETVITVVNQELDTLNILDTTSVTPRLCSIEEMVRLFRSITVLTPLQKRIIEMRYLSVINEYERRLVYIDILYHATRTTI